MAAGIYPTNRATDPFRGEYWAAGQAQAKIESIRQQYQHQLQQIQAAYKMGIQGFSFSDKEKVENLKEQVQELKVIIKSLQKRVKGDTVMKSDFFRRSGLCVEHDEEDCTECMNAYMNAKKDEDSRAITVVSSSLIHGNGDAQTEEMRLSAHHIMQRQLRFVKKALGVSDVSLKKKKVKELPKLLKDAEDNITIGGMEELLEEDNKDARGFIKGILRFFLKMGKKS